MTRASEQQNGEGPPTIAALDVGYRTTGALGAGVLFKGWEADRTMAEATVETAAVADYVPGEFYLRELPILLSVISQLPQVPNHIVIDGYVWLNEERPGLGGHLWAALDERPVVVGVAKNPFRGASPCAEVRRGNSTRPLFVTSAGIPLAEACHHVATMHGPHRIPTILRRVDALSRGASTAHR